MLHRNLMLHNIRFLINNSKQSFRGVYYDLYIRTQSKYFQTAVDPCLKPKFLHNMI